MWKRTRISPYIACISLHKVVALSTPRVPRLSQSALSTRYFLCLLLKYESNIGGVSGYHRFEVITNFKKLVFAVFVSAVFFTTAILITRICRRSLRFDYRCDYRRRRGHRCCCRAARRSCSRCSCNLDFRNCPCYCRNSLQSSAPHSLVSGLSNVARRNVTPTLRIDPRHKYSSPRR